MSSTWNYGLVLKTAVGLCHKEYSVFRIKDFFLVVLSCGKTFGWHARHIFSNRAVSVEVVIYFTPGFTGSSSQLERAISLSLYLSVWGQQPAQMFSKWKLYMFRLFPVATAFVCLKLQDVHACLCINFIFHLIFLACPKRLKRRPEQYIYMYIFLKWDTRLHTFHLLHKWNVCEAEFVHLQSTEDLLLK